MSLKESKGFTPWASVDGASLGAFRILFGALALVGTVRFVINGWVEQIYLQPTFHFHYFGFAWVKPWPDPWMYVHMAIMAAAAFGLMLGWRARLCALVYFVTFTYAELIERASYLNHYYLVSLFALLLIFVPSDRCFALRPNRSRQTVPALAVWVLRFQVAVVYFYAGLTKLHADWLLRGEPLYTWLQVHDHLPLVGAFMTERWAALTMSWCGALFDLSAPWALLHPRTRPWAYFAVVGFHVLTWVLFPIGMFPWIMIASATLFFPYDWPRRVLAGRNLTPRLTEHESHPPAQTRKGVLPLVAVATYASVQVIMPLRFLAYPGDHRWTHEGFDFAWKVMLVEKNGIVEFEVTNPSTGRTHLHRPRIHLEPFQHKAMTTTPDLIVQYAHHLAQQHEKRTGVVPEVRADAWMSLNGSRSRRLIDPSVDLVQVRPTLQPATWVKRY